MNCPRPAAGGGRVVGEADREDLPGHREQPGEEDREPHVRRRGQRVAERQHRVVEHLAAGRHGADLVAGIPAEQDRRDQQAERVRDGVHDDRDDGGRELQDARAQVAVEERDPEVPVLLPERQVEVERPHVVVVELLGDLRVLDLDPAHERQHRVARHQVRDRPVDRHRDDERHAVDEELPDEVAQHAISSLTVSGRRVVAPPRLGGEEPRSLADVLPQSTVPRLTSPA